ncbi:Uma2 family endonuclease [Pantanalinema sp. GBBB05]|uniref:Uma2 family endonuclease n=1 Tax=Pantanalinema sp. GBBB05 TaxID=2604139 RepID=UPI001D91314A|nr:Uma2 family endonuclease [Pantanalinema sp. GBBB05]
MSSVMTKRFTVDDYHRLIELGFIKEGDRIELIRGELVQMVAKGTSHSSCNTRLLYELLPLLGDRAIVRHQDPVTLPRHSEPEPDFAIVKVRSDRYRSAHPQPKDILLIIEVSDSTLTYDQTTKLSVYAEHQIPDYWIVNLVANQLECYSQPYRTPSDEYGYRLKQIALPNETIALPSFEDLRLNLAAVLDTQPNQ